MWKSCILYGYMLNQEWTIHFPKRSHKQLLWRITAALSSANDDATLLLLLMLSHPPLTALMPQTWQGQPKGQIWSTGSKMPRTVLNRWWESLLLRRRKNEILKNWVTQATVWSSHIFSSFEACDFQAILWTVLKFSSLQKELDTVFHEK